MAKVDSSVYTKLKVISLSILVVSMFSVAHGWVHVEATVRAFVEGTPSNKTLATETWLILQYDLITIGSM